MGSVFWNLAGTDSTEETRAIEREMSPKMAEHWTAINTNRALFARIDALVRMQDSLDLTTEQRQVLKKTHTSFIKGGARLEGAARERAGAIKQRLAALTTQFSQNVLKDKRIGSLNSARRISMDCPVFW